MQQCHKPKSNIIFSGSVRKNDESDYLLLRSLLYRERISIGEYLISAYRELDKGSTDVARFKALRWSR